LAFGHYTGQQASPGYFLEENMLKNKSKLLWMIALCAAILFIAAGCSGGDNDDGPAGNAPGTQSPTTPDGTPAGPGGEGGRQPAADAPVSASGFMPLSLLPKDAAGEITYLSYGHEDKLYRNVGDPNFNAEFTVHNYGDLLPLHASAVEFNKLYPNIIINVLVVTFDHYGDEDNGISLHQSIENVRNDLGIMPDIWEIHDLKTEILTGNISDLSQYRNEMSFQAFNDTLMDMMTYHGFVGGLPAWFNPWGHLINHELAAQNNIDSPPVNWTYNQYINYISQADMSSFFGDIYMQSAMLIGLGAKSVAYEATRGSGYVDFNTDEVRRMLDLTGRGVRYTVYANYDAGLISDATMDRYWWWSTRFFYDNVLLANIWDNWMLGFLASSDPNELYKMRHDNWDMYPLPSSDELPNTIGIVFDPAVIRNYAGEADAQHKLDVAYAFLAFHQGSNEAFIARNGMTAVVMTDSGDMVERRPVLDSFPLVKSPNFEIQMEAWYDTPAHEKLKDKNSFPGFHECVRIYLEGGFWAMDGRTFPDKYVLDGEIRDVFEEWNGMNSEEYAGVDYMDPAWADQVKSRLADWTEKTNPRLDLARESIRDALKRYYGYTDDMFN